MHLHASDNCRFTVESKLFPNLTAALTGIKGGFYTQEDVKAMIAYGSNLGIRVVPEFDVPGHTKGFEPLAWGASPAIQFCNLTTMRCYQLLDDPAGVTYKTIHAVMGEMAALFTDEVFNVGCDETWARGRCTARSVLSFEQRLFNATLNEFKKTPAAWEEVLFDTKSATPQTIIHLFEGGQYPYHTPAEVAATGRRVVQSASSHFYFTEAAHGGPAGWSKCYWDISDGMVANKSMLLGGEMSMWTDTYCYIDNCRDPKNIPIGHELFSPAADVAFQKSIGGMIWPRGFVAAASYWNWVNGTDPASPAFVEGIWKLNDALHARNLSTCPSNCSCDQRSACGKPYITPSPPVSL